MTQRIVRAAALLRVSTTRVEQEDSPDAQLAFIRSEIAKRTDDKEAWVDTGEVYRDELTGALVLERKDVKRALVDAREGKFDMLVMKSISRMGRDTLGLLQFKRHLDDLDIELVALQDNYRSGRDEELIFLIFADRAQAGRKEISKNVRNNMLQRARAGKWVTGHLPFGYQRVNRNQLQHHPETAPIVLQIYGWRLRGTGLPTIARRLNETGIQSPRWWELRDRIPVLEAKALADERWLPRLETAKKALSRRYTWSVTVVKQILENAVYKGEGIYNRDYNRRLLGGVVKRTRRPEEEWISVPAPPLVTEEEWQAVQDMRRRHTANRRSAESYVLSGIIYCGDCGGRMSGASSTFKGKLYRYYRCWSRIARGNCNMLRQPAERLDLDVLNQLQASLAAVPDYVKPDDSLARRAKLAEGKLTSLNEQLADLADDRRYYHTARRKEQVTDEELDVELARIKTAERNLKKQIADLTTEAHAPENAAKATQQLQQLRLQVARWASGELSVDEIRQLVTSAVERIDVSPDGSLRVHPRWVVVG